ncbi:MAG TPA: ATP-binding protein [Candidatus Binatia bacterium]
MTTDGEAADHETAIAHASGIAVDEPRTFRIRERWLGLAVGAAIGLVDLIGTLALGIHFEMNGSDVTLLVLGVYGVTFAAFGFTFGLVLEARRRDRKAAAIIAQQMETVATTRARLAQSEKLVALGQLAAAIAHEVRNALGVIRSAAQGLAESVPADDVERQRACSFISAEIDRLGSVVSSLLGFARPLRLAPRPVEVSKLFDQALLLARPDLEAKEIRVVRREDGALPPVRADSDLVVQVLLGLLANAVEAVPRGGEVALEARATDGVVEIGVADSGPGIPEDLRARVFEPFFTTRDKGTGLGLAVARQIVEAHQGRIEVGERPGGGARFCISLPLATVAPAALARSA